MGPCTHALLCPECKRKGDRLRTLSKRLEAAERELTAARKERDALRAALLGVRGGKPCFCRTNRENDLAECFADLAESGAWLHTAACVAATDALRAHQEDP